MPGFNSRAFLWLLKFIFSDLSLDKKLNQYLVNDRLYFYILLVTLIFPHYELALCYCSQY